MLSSTILFSKAELFHLILLSSPVQYYHKLKESLTALPPHALFRRSELSQPTSPCHGHAVLHAPTKPISLTSFSAFFTEIRMYFLHLSCLYIWFVGNSKVFHIFYIESKIGDEKFAFFFFFIFFFFVWCLGFRIWFNDINPWWWVFNLWWWKFASLLFFLCLMFG